jgi:hypothetical protein
LWQQNRAKLERVAHGGIMGFMQSPDSEEVTRQMERFLRDKARQIAGNFFYGLVIA